MSVMHILRSLDALPLAHGLGMPPLRLRHRHRRFDGARRDDQLRHVRAAHDACAGGQGGRDAGLLAVIFSERILAAYVTDRLIQEEKYLVRERAVFISRHLLQRRAERQGHSDTDL